MANIYLIRAQSDPAKRQEWVLKGAYYTEKALSVTSRSEDIAGVHLFEAARSFERTGDFATKGCCDYYARARKLLEDRVPLLQGDRVTLDGKDFPLGPLRIENEKVTEEVKTKAANAGCSASNRSS